MCHFLCYIPAVPGFQDAIRGYVLHSISISFQRVSMRVLGDWLKLDGAALQQLLAEKVRLTIFLHLRGFRAGVCAGRLVEAGQGSAEAVLAEKVRSFFLTFFPFLSMFFSWDMCQRVCWATG
jgi:hypothetical protein